MSVGQTDFSRALLDPDRPVPPGLTDPQGRPAGKRFAVYRNNVAVSLTEALMTAFPVVCKLVGEEFFRAMAGVFLRRHPPSSPVLMFYGESFADFLSSFEPVGHLGYLPDIARLELALRQSYHAADATPLDPRTLQALPVDRLLSSRLALAPALRLIRSPWPVFAIWLANRRDDAPKPQMRAEDVLITRPGFDPEPVLLGAGGADFIAALQAGRSVAEAIDAAGPEFDLAAALGALLAGQAITSLDEGT